MENLMEKVIEKWNDILNTVKMEHEISDISFETWMRPLDVYAVEGSVLYILAPFEPMALNYIQKKYYLPLKVAIGEMLGEEYDIKFVLPEDAKTINVNKPVKKVASLNGSNSNLNPNYTFETFVVGGNNRFAQSAALAVAESPGETYNPLYIYGGPGLGKTHLMHSIGHFILDQNPDTKVIYVTSEEFTNEVIDSIRNGNASSMSKFRDKYRKVDVLMIDDIQFIIGKESTQEEFFHTFNALQTQGKQIILTSDKPPKEMETLDERFRSRFGWGMIADINAPDYETRVAILRKKCENLNKKIDDSIIQYIANNIKSNIRELEGALNKILAFSKLNNIPITQSMAEEALKDMISPHQEKEITPELILQVVCEHYNINEQAVLSSKKTKDISAVRHIFMYLCRDCINDISLMNIAEFLGKKDHTTIMHGIRKIETDIEKDFKLKSNIEVIKKKLLC